MRLCLWGVTIPCGSGGADPFSLIFIAHLPPATLLGPQLSQAESSWEISWSYEEGDPLLSGIFAVSLELLGSILAPMCIETA